MYRLRLTNPAAGLLIAAALATNGCMFVPQWARLSSSDSSHTEKLAAAVESLELAEAAAPTTDPDTDNARAEDGMPASKPDHAASSENSESAELKAFIAELEEYPEIGLADRNELLRQLHQTEPALLDLVIRQYRANLAFQRQRKDRDRKLTETKATSGVAKADTSAATPPAASSAAKTEAKPPAVLPSGLAKSKDKPEKPVKTAGPAVGIAVGGALARPSNKQAGSAMPAVGPPRLSIADRLVNTDRSSVGKPKSPVVAASFESKPPADWRDQLKGAVESLESSVNQTPDSPEEISDHARLRLLCLAAQRRDKALRPIPTLDSEMTEFWSKEVFGLAVLLDTEMIPDAAQRISEAKGHFEEAINRLSESAPLVVRNMAFINKVDSYGVYNTFDSDEFTPGQRVGLYVEVENFASKEGPRGFHTSLKSSYQILDSRGQRVADDEFLPNQENCRNRRRDYFIFYEFNMPERLYPGDYTLKLTVTDANSEKFGESQVEFYIKDEKD